MKKQAINFSWPADLSDFSVDAEQGNYSRAKLKVFYKGETEDKRFFSDGFAEELINTLPYTPVVSYYDEEKDDFVGHATEQQIYGIVDPNSDITFETMDDGKTWCVCDVVLYTKRPDLVGKIASKIVGHKQSLELDPSSVKYVVNYDEKKHFKNIEFTAGRFIGVSVLGNDQKPAFADSSFFCYNEDFEEKMQALREYCESKNGQTQNGGETMNLQEFMKLSWGEVSLKVDEAVSHEYASDAWTYIVDMFDDRAIVKFYYYIDGSCKLMGINYSIDENGDVSLGDIHEVRVVYENVEEAPVSNDYERTDIEQAPTVEEGVDAGSQNANNDTTEGTESENGTNAFEDTQTNAEETPTEGEEQAPVEEPTPAEATPTEEETPNNFVQNQSADPAQVSNVEDTPTEKVSANNEQESNSQENSSSASFTQDERAEFEALKREEKISLVNSYKEDLPEEVIADFLSQIDSFEKTALELELLKAYKANAKQTKQMRAFTFAPVNNNVTENSLDSFVKKHLGK